jgi:hypothetical protein
MKFGILRNSGNVIGRPITLRAGQLIFRSSLVSRRDLTWARSVPSHYHRPNFPSMFSFRWSFQLAESLLCIGCITTRFVPEIRVLIFSFCIIPSFAQRFSKHRSQWTLQRFHISSHAKSPQKGLSSCIHLFGIRHPHIVFHRVARYHSPRSSFAHEPWPLKSSSLLHRVSEAVQDRDGIVPSNARVCNADTVLQTALSFLRNLLVACTFVSVCDGCRRGVSTYPR